MALTLAALSLLWVVQRQAANRSAEALCAACGYNLRGLPGNTCPECGNDIRGRDAIRGPDWPYAGHTLSRLVQWTILLPLAGLTVSGLVAMFLELREARRSLFLAPPRQHGNVVITAAGEGYGRPVGMDYVSIELADPGAGKQVRVDVDAGSLRYREPGRSRNWSRRSLDASVVSEWLTRAGLGGASAEGRADAEELAALIRSTAEDRHWDPAPTRFRLAGRDERESPRPDTRFRPIAAGVWSAVWLAGALWILRAPRVSAARRRP